MDRGRLLWAVASRAKPSPTVSSERFKATAESRGTTCETGLWRYSRHPNYFFEWVIWVAYALFALASPWAGVAGWLSPALMLYLLCRVTGIPATEAQAVRSRGDDYRRYQQTTSAFVPWFRAAEDAMIERLLDRDLAAGRGVRLGIRRIVARPPARARRPAARAAAARLQALLARLRQQPIAVATDAANAQHYEVPAAFFERVLGPHLKYSSAWWPTGVATLAEAEDAMLALTTSARGSQMASACSSSAAAGDR